MDQSRRYWSKVDKRGEGECWSWTAYRNRKGYGMFAIGGGMSIMAHRMAWELEYGEIPEVNEFGERIFVLHKCDNPPCQNPKHLYLGTGADNMRDREGRGRRMRGTGKGYYWDKQKKKWKAVIRDGHARQRVIGFYVSEEDARQAYLDAFEETQGG